MNAGPCAGSSKPGPTSVRTPAWNHLQSSKALPTQDLNLQVNTRQPRHSGGQTAPSDTSPCSPPKKRRKGSTGTVKHAVQDHHGVSQAPMQAPNIGLRNDPEHDDPAGQHSRLAATSTPRPSVFPRRPRCHDIAMRLSTGGEADYTRHDLPPSIAKARVSTKPSSDQRAYVSSTERNWNDKATEHSLTERSIRDGYSNKSLIPNEMNSARSSLWPHIKQKASTQHLSAVFSSVLALQCRDGKVNGESTFKPPPRVTLTDAKKIAWLRDLADETLPLRKLSRTIPHGIRGWSLLEQCVSNRVPLSRALWLIKCVGANELRAFKRRGISDSVIFENEQRWVNEWTDTVSSFSEKLLDTYPSPEDVKYFLNLTVHLFSDFLLDRKQFLSWIVTFFSQTPLQKLLSPLLLVSCWKDNIVSNIQTGHMLASTTIHKLEHINRQPRQGAWMIISQRIKSLYWDLVSSSPYIFLFPQETKKSLHSLQLLPGDTGEPFNFAIRFIKHSNTKLFLSPATNPTDSLDDASHLFTCLDAGRVDDAINMAMLPGSRFHSNSEGFVSSVLQWASNLSETFPMRYVTAAQVLRRPEEHGIDITGLIFDHLVAAEGTTALRPRAASAVFAELACSGSLNVARYLRWLITTGSFDESGSQRWETSAVVHFLKDIPLPYVTGQVAALRSQLMRRLDICSSESRSATNIKDTIAQHLPRLCPRDCSISRIAYRDLLHSISQADLSVRFHVGAFIRSILRPLANHKLDEPDFPSSQGLFDVSPIEIFVLCKVLEALGDIRTFAVAIRQLTKVANMESVSILVDSLTTNKTIFDHLGVSKSLQIGLLKRYQALRVDIAPRRMTVCSFLDSIKRIGQSTDDFNYLQDELSLCNQSCGLAANTPASEGVLNDLQGSSAEVDEGLEQIFASGASLDGVTAVRVLQRIKCLIQESESLSKAQNVILRYGSLLSALRVIDEENFNLSTLAWLQEIADETVSSGLFKSLGASLVGFGCFNVSRTLDHLEMEMSGEATASKDKKNLVVGILEALSVGDLELMDMVRESSSHLPADHDPSFLPLHRYTVEREKAYTNRCVTILKLLLHVLTLTQPNETPLLARIENIATSDWNQRAFGTLAFKDPSFAQELLKQQLEFRSRDVPIETTSKILKAWMDPEGLLGLHRTDITGTIRTCFEHANRFSAPRLAVGLSLLIDFEHDREDSDCKMLQETMVEAVKRSIASKTANWSVFVHQLSDSSTVTAKVREEAEKHILKDIHLTLPTMQQRSQSFSTYEEALDTISATSANIRAGGVPEAAKKIIGKFEKMSRSFSEAHGSQTPPNDDTLGCTEALLGLTLIHRRSFNDETHSETSRAKLLIGICRLLLGASVRLTEKMRQAATEVAASFAADLDEANTMHVLQQLDDVASHPLLRYLFGSTRDWRAEQLMLTSGQEHKRSSADEERTASYKDGGFKDSAAMVPMAMRRWEILPDTTANGTSETALSMGLFGARKA